MTSSGLWPSSCSALGVGQRRGIKPQASSVSRTKSQPPHFRPTTQAAPRFLPEGRGPQSPVSKCPSPHPPPHTHFLGQLEAAPCGGQSQTHTGLHMRSFQSQKMATEPVTPTRKQASRQHEPQDLHSGSKTADSQRVFCFLLLKPDSKQQELEGKTPRDRICILPFAMGPRESDSAPLWVCVENINA